MMAYGLHKAMRLGWIAAHYIGNAKAAWTYVQENILPDGGLHGCYSGWAVPAEARKMDFNRPMHWMPGLVLLAGAEMMRPDAAC